MPTSRWLYWGGIAAAVCGAVLCVLGWYGVSGEPTAARQLPYLASATVPGAALLVAGAVLLAASARVRPPGAGGDGPDAGGSREQVADPVRVPAVPAPHTAPRPVRVPGGTLFHRPDCPLVAGKPVTSAAGGAPLTPCPVCEPGRGRGPDPGRDAAGDDGAPGAAGPAGTTPPGETGGDGTGGHGAGEGRERPWGR